MPYIIKYRVELRNGGKETRELLYKPDNPTTLTPEYADHLKGYHRLDYFGDCITVDYQSHREVTDDEAKAWQASARFPGKAN